MVRYPRKMDASCAQFHDHQGVVGDKPVPGGHFYPEKVRAGEHGPVHLEKLRPTHASLTPLRCRIDMMTPKDVAHGDLVNFVSEVGKGTLDAAIALGRVVTGHLQDECFDLIRDTGAPQLVALLAAVKFLGAKLFVPAHQGIRRGESS